MPLNNKRMLLPLFLGMYFLVSRGHITEKPLTTNKKIALYTDDNDIEMGFISYRGPHAFTDPCSIIYLTTYEDYQNQGIGSQLYDYARQSMKAMGCDNVTFDARPSAVAFYLKRGAEIVHKKQDPDKDNTVPMKHTL